VANAFAKTLEANKGALVQMNSIASIKTFPPFDLLCLKSGVIFINTSIKNRIRTKRVTVLSVHPGPVATAMADAAGFENPADTTVVSEGIINALEAGDFHLFPDEMAKQIEAAYQSFSDNVIMVDFSNNKVEQGRVYFETSSEEYLKFNLIKSKKMRK
jgi:short-subunit dehydrogenase